MNVLITGGAGYIGSHMVYKLKEEGYNPFVIDDLSTGKRELIPDDIDFFKACIGSGEQITNYLKENKIEAVIHFAAKIIVPESIKNPLKYYIGNTNKTNSLISSCIDAKIEKFIFSSTAAVYGNISSSNSKVNEISPTNPENPYGLSKLLSEQILRDISKLLNFRFVILRYFNVAGADPLFRTGQMTKNATHLIKIACEAALNKRDFVEVYGNDFGTPDGSGVRDYIHVSDLVDAHFSGLKYLNDGFDSITLNCGYGIGHSVFEVLKEVEKVSGKKLKIKVVGRRDGDVGYLVSDNKLLKNKFLWNANHQSLNKIISDSFNWEKKMHNKKIK